MLRKQPSVAFGGLRGWTLIKKIKTPRSKSSFKGIMEICSIHKKSKIEDIGDGRHNYSNVYILHLQVSYSGYKADGLLCSSLLRNSSNPRISISWTTKCSRRFFKIIYPSNLQIFYLIFFIYLIKPSLIFLIIFHLLLECKRKYTIGTFI